MRLFRALLVVLVPLVACDRQAQPVAAVAPASCPPPPALQAPSTSNGTTFTVEMMNSPPSSMSLQLGAPELGERIASDSAREYRVKLTVSSPEPDALGFDIALDDQRPRRLSVAETSVTLGKLLPVDMALAPGPHWLFAAPVTASGLVPQAASRPGRSALARRFFVGQTAKGAGSDASGPSGATWLRKPEGTYNGAKAAARVLFDCYTFSATGALLDVACTIDLRAPAGGGILRLAAPFAIQDAPNGDYTAQASALAARPTSARFTVNRELGNGS